jgi:hypothetical protein
MGTSMMDQPDDKAPQAMDLQASEVALFKGCGWPVQQHDCGIVHRSLRISDTGLARLVLALDAARPLHMERCL